MKSRTANALATAYFGFVTAIFAWPVFLGRSSSVIPGIQSRLWPWQGVVDPSQNLFPQRDGAVSSYPWSVTYHHAMRLGDFPFWDWHSFLGGYDLASDGVSGAMYPLHWLVWTVFSPPSAHDAFMILHLWLGGVVMYFLLRHWELAFLPSLVGGTVWMLSAFNVSWIQAEMITPVLVMVPLVFWRIDCAIRRGTLGDRVAAAGSLAIALVAGNVVVFLVIGWVAGLYAVSLVIGGQVRRWNSERLWSQIKTLIFVSVGALGFAAYSLVPTFANLLSLGRRTATLAEASPAPTSMVSNFQSMWTTPSPIETTGSLFILGWCGKVALILALLGVLKRGKGRAVAIALALFFALLPASPFLVSVGWYTILPLRAVSGFGRLLFFESFGIAILAGLGVARVTRLVEILVKRAFAFPQARLAPMILGAVLISAVLMEMVPFAIAANPPWRSRPEAGFFPVTGAQKILAAKSDKPGDWPGLMLPLTVQSTSSLAPDLAWSGTSFWGATAHIAAIDSVGGYDSAVPWRAASLTRVMQGVNLTDAVQRFSTAFLPDFSVTWSRLDLMRKLGVTHIYAPPGVDLKKSAYSGWASGLALVYDGPDGQVWEVNGSQRSPRLVDRVELVKRPEDALDAFVRPDFDSSVSAILESGKDDTVSSTSRETVSNEGPTGTVLNSERGSNSAALNLTVFRDSWLVVPIGYSEGWSAKVDNVGVETRPANFAFTALHVTPGAHHVTLEYRPPGFFLGSVLTLLSVGIAALLAFFGATRQKMAGMAFLRTARISWRRRHQ